VVKGKAMRECLPGSQFPACSGIRVASLLIITISALPWSFTENEHREVVAAEK
jgi:hypothetical protein